MGTGVPLLDIFTERLPAALSPDAASVYGPGLSGALQAFNRPAGVTLARMERQVRDSVGQQNLDSLLQRAASGQEDPRALAREMQEMMIRAQQSGSPRKVVERVFDPYRGMAALGLDLAKPADAGFMAVDTAARNPKLVAPAITAIGSYGANMGRRNLLDEQTITEQQLRPGAQDAAEALAARRYAAAGLDTARTETEDTLRDPLASEALDDAAIKLQERLALPEEQALERADSLRKMLAGRKQARAARQESVQRIRESRQREAESRWRMNRPQPAVQADQFGDVSLGTPTPMPQAQTAVPQAAPAAPPQASKGIALSPALAEQMASGRPVSGKAILRDLIAQGRDPQEAYALTQQLVRQYGVKPQ